MANLILPINRVIRLSVNPKFLIHFKDTLGMIFNVPHAKKTLIKN
jgi:hypothetical protein